jgi:hypothetical protein
MYFEKELAMLINKYSKENESDTPDFILARYLKCCLANYTETVRAREAAIHKECADRAVECGEKAGMNKLQFASLRAAIEGRP